MSQFNYDSEELAKALRAKLEVQPDDDPEYLTHEYRFSDTRLRYVLLIRPNMGSAFLSADPEEPQQGCPMLEYSFSISKIRVGESAYSDSQAPEIAIRFYDGHESQDEQRLTMTWIPLGYWYIWANAYRN